MVLGTALISSSFGFCGSADALNDRVGKTCVAVSVGVVMLLSAAKTEVLILSNAELSTLNFPE
jgi:hypothetical protein